jgi:hypothetical protein
MKHITIYAFILIASIVIFILPRKERAIKALIKWARRKGLMWERHFLLTTESNPMQRMVCNYDILPRIAVGSMNTAYTKFNIVKISKLTSID